VDGGAVGAGQREAWELEVSPDGTVSLTDVRVT
jgi:hypothetical protein